MALDFFAGCMGGIAGVFVGHPFDTIKVRLQTFSSGSVKYKNGLDAFLTIMKKESALGLMKGLTSPLYGQAACNAIVFGLQAKMMRFLNNPDSVISHGIAGFTAGVAQSVVCSPLELAKTRMQNQGLNEQYSLFTRSKDSMYKGPMDCLKQIYIKEGLRGISKGGLLTVLREGPAFTVYFMVYEYLCRQWTTANNAPSTSVLLLAGGTAGVACWVISYPVDVIKTRIQGDISNYYKGAWHCTVHSYKTEGLQVFHRGLITTCVRAFPVNAATFTTVAWVLKISQGGGKDACPSCSIATELDPFCSSNHIMCVMSNFPCHHW